MIFSSGLIFSPALFSSIASALPAAAVHPFAQSHILLGFFPDHDSSVRYPVSHWGGSQRPLLTPPAVQSPSYSDYRKDTCFSAPVQTQDSDERTALPASDSPVPSHSPSAWSALPHFWRTPASGMPEEAHCRYSRRRDT